jgi:hypothetical protein
MRRVPNKDIEALAWARAKWRTRLMVLRDLMSVKKDIDGASHFCMMFSLCGMLALAPSSQSNHCPYLLVFPCHIAAQVLLGIDDQTGSFSEVGFEHGIARHDWNPVVPTLDDQVDLRDHRFHFGQAGRMVA